MKNMMMIGLKEVFSWSGRNSTNMAREAVGMGCCSINI